MVSYKLLSAKIHLIEVNGACILLIKRSKNCLYCIQMKTNMAQFPIFIYVLIIFLSLFLVETNRSMTFLKLFSFKFSLLHNILSHCSDIS